MNEDEFEKDMEEMFGNKDIDKLLEESAKELRDPNTKYLTHEELFSSMKKLIDGEEE